MNALHSVIGESFAKPVDKEIFVVASVLESFESEYVRVAGLAYNSVATHLRVVFNPFLVKRAVEITAEYACVGISAALREVFRKGAQVVVCPRRLRAYVQR